MKYQPANRVVLLVLVLLLLLASIPPSFALPPFVIESVVQGQGGARASLTYDATGTPVLSFEDGGDLKMARWQGGAWVVATVDTVGSVGSSTAIAVDVSGVVYIAYRDIANRDLKCALLRDGAWEFETVDPDADNGWTAIALDAAGRPHIAYYGGFSSHDAMYAVRSGEVWTTTLVYPQALSSGDMISLDVTSDGIPHISFHDVFLKDIMYATLENGVWVIETVESTGDLGLNSSIRLDSTQAPHIAFLDLTTRALRYSSRIDSLWITETVEADIDPGHFPSLLFDEDDIPSICSWDPAYGMLKYARRSAGWTTEYIDRSGDVGEGCAAAVDPYGNLGVAFYDQSEDALKLADSAVRLASPVGGERWRAGASGVIEWTGSGAVDVELSTDGGGTWSTMLTAVRGGRAAIVVPDQPTAAARVRIQRADPPSASMSTSPFAIDGFPSSPTPFSIETVDATGTVGEYASLALGADEAVHVAYYDRTNGDAKYAVKRFGSWAVETVDASGNAGQYVSLGLDTGGRPHAAYYDATGGDLEYAVRLGGLWTHETVDSVGNVGQYASLALDALGNPHIGYYDASALDLKYAFRSGGIWSSETVDSLGTVGGHVSLALDALGNVHIAYYDFSNGNLKYGLREAGSWTLETVDTEGSVGLFTSLAVDGGGVPHIAYFDNTLDDLKYARRVAGEWVIETVDGEGSVGRHVSLTLDPDGSPRMAYYDLTRGRLHYVTRKADIWWHEEIGGPTNAGSHASLAVDELGNPVVAFYDETSKDLKVADAAVHLVSPAGGERWRTEGSALVQWEGAGPVDVELSYDGGVSYSPFLTGLSGGEALVTVPDHVTGSARVRVRRAQPLSVSASATSFDILDFESPWWSATLDSAGAVGAFSALAIDRLGRSHIAYYDEASGHLLYTMRSGGGWVRETADGTGGVGEQISIAVGPDPDLVHVAYYDRANRQLRYAKKEDGVWATEVVDATTGAGSGTSIAVDDAGIPHIAYYESTADDLKYAVRSGGTWTLQTVDSGGNVGGSPSLALEANGDAHISYSDATNGDLKYAVLRGSTWTLSIVDSAGSTGSSTSIALGPDSAPHIAYRDVTEANLRYARLRDGVWERETVDGTATTPLYPSLAVDANGVPHIGYYDSTLDDLRYARRTARGWVLETLASSGNTGAYSSLGLDPWGNPRIAFLDVTHADLGYVSSSVELRDPHPGVVWPVGGGRTVRWDGIGPVDVMLSVDGGHSYTVLATGVAGNAHALTVPHQPSRFSKVRIVRNALGSSSETDSLFSIESSIALLSLRTAPAEDAPGLVVSWSTQPGAEDLRGYRLEKRRETPEWLTLVSLTRDGSFHDPDGSPADVYRLFAVNNLDETLYLGETSLQGAVSMPALTAYPLPYRNGDLVIEFRTGGSTEEPVTVEVFDARGRRVATIARDVKSGPAGRFLWDGRDRAGRSLASGIYFVAVRTSAGTQIRKLPIAR